MEGFLDVILSRVDVPVVGAVIWLFNAVAVKPDTCKIPTQYIPWISILLGVICALIGALSQSIIPPFTSTAVATVAKSALLYAMVAVLIQTYLKKGMFDIGKAFINAKQKTK